MLGMPTISLLIVKEKQQLTNPSSFVSFFVTELDLRCETGVLIPDEGKLITGL